MTAMHKHPSPARPASKMKGGGTSSRPDAPSLVRCRATPKLPAPNIRQSSLENIVARAHLIRCSSSLMPHDSKLNDRERGAAEESAAGSEGRGMGRSG